VLGMHRSGTSAATRVVEMLGPHGGRDPIEPDAANPTGYWESRALTALNEQLLDRLGGSWWDPPALPDGWEREASLDALRTSGAASFGEVFPSQPWVWKDPRNCLTLPFWTATLDVDPVAIVVTRDPLEIARSLERRNAFPTAFSLALWERYTRELLHNLTGRPALVTSFAALTGDPAAWAAAVRGYLDGKGIATADPDTTAVRGFVDPSRRPTGDGFAASTEGSDAQQELHRVVARLAGAHERLDVSLPTPTPGTDALFEEQRRAVEAHWSRLRSKRAGRGRPPR
jgi:hypothetical protein